MYDVVAVSVGVVANDSNHCSDIIACVWYLCTEDYLGTSVICCLGYVRDGGTDL